MAANDREFTLIGRFDDKITKSLELINKSIKTLTTNFEVLNKQTAPVATGIDKMSKSMDELLKRVDASQKSTVEATKAFQGLTTASQEIGRATAGLDAVTRSVDGMLQKLQQTQRSTTEEYNALMRMAQASRATDVAGESLGKMAENAHQAKEESEDLLGTLLKFEALKEMGHGIAEGLMEGMHKAVETLHKGLEFVTERFHEAVEDEGEHIAAQVQYYAQLKEKGYFKDTSQMGPHEAAMQNMLNMNISREQYEIGETQVQKFNKFLGTNQDTVTAAYRAIAEFANPALMKGLGITSDTSPAEMARILQSGAKEKLTGMSYAELVGGGTAGIANLVAAQGPMGGQNIIPELQHFIESGQKNSQAAAFQNNIFRKEVTELTEKFQGIGFGEVDARAIAVLEAASKAFPKEAIAISQQTIQSGMTQLQAAIMSPKTGILSLNAPMLGKRVGGKELEFGFGAKLAAGGMDVELDEKLRPKTVKEGSVLAIHMREIDQHYEELKKLAKGNVAREKQLQERKEEEVEALYSRYRAISSPMDIITAELGPVLGNFAQMLGQANSMFIEPVMEVMKYLGPALARMNTALINLTHDVAAFYKGEPKGRSLANALGRAVAEFFKALAAPFTEGNIAKKANDGIGQFISDFLAGFKSIDGAKYVKIVMDGLKDIIMHVLFNEGDVFKGTTIIGSTLLKMAALFAAPAILTASLNAIMFVALDGMKDLFTGVFKGLKEKGLVARVKEKLGKGAAAAEGAEGAAAAEGAAKPLSMSQKFLMGEQARKVASSGAITEAVVAVEEAAPMFGNFGRFFTGIGPRFMGFFEGIGGKLGILGAILTSIISLFQGKGLGESLAAGAGPLLGAALGAALTPFFPPLGAFIGGWIGSQKAIIEPLTAMFDGLLGALKGFWEVVVMIGRVTVDLFQGIMDVITGLFGMKGSIDVIQFALVPITATAQLLEIAFRGLAVVMAMFRTQMKRWFGSGEEYQEALQDEQRLRGEFYTAQGKQNAYNMKMNTENLKRGYNDAVYEFQHDANMSKERSIELKAFITDAKKYLEAAGVHVKPSTPPAGGKGGTHPTTPPGHTATGPHAKPHKPVDRAGNAFVEGSKKAWGVTVSASIGAWNSFSSWFQSIPSQLSGLWNSVVEAGSQAWGSFKKWLDNLPYDIIFAVAYVVEEIKLFPDRFGKAFNQAVKSVSEGVTHLRDAVGRSINRAKASIIAGAKSFAQGLHEFPGKVAKAIDNLKARVGNAVKNAVSSITKAAGDLYKGFQDLSKKLGDAKTRVLTYISRINWAEIGTRLASGIGKIVAILMNPGGALFSAVMSRIDPRRAAQAVAAGQAAARGPTKAKAFGESRPFVGSLGEAISFEMANKPAGSHLVIANSSETIIPAAGGAGRGVADIISAIWSSGQMTTSSLGRSMEDMTRQTTSSMDRGFGDTKDTYRQEQRETIGAIERLSVQSARESQSALQAIKAAAAAGGLIGGVPGSLQGALGLAKRLGLIMTSFTGGKHATHSYHYLGRAMDFGGDPGAMNRLAAALMHTRPTELIHAPGYSMKDGHVVPPSYWGASTWNNHYNHVHVAYGLGSGNPAFFSSQSDAEAWERSIAPAGSDIMSITTNSGEGFGAMFNSASKLNLGQLTSIAKMVGFSEDSASVMAAIAMAESGGNPRAHNPVPPDNSYGLWQINMLGGMGPERRSAYGLGSNEDLFNPLTNAKVAYALSGKGINFRPWSTYTNGAYKKYLSSLDHVAYALGEGNPALFSSKAAAENWERKMIPSDMKVKTITTNSGEVAGASTINAPITIYQQPNQDPTELAEIVAMRIAMAVDEARNHL